MELELRRDAHLSRVLVQVGLHVVVVNLVGCESFLEHAERRETVRKRSALAVERGVRQNRRENYGSPVKNTRMNSLATVRHDADDDLCEEEERRRSAKATRFVSLAQLTLPTIVSPSLRLLPLAELSDVLHDTVHGAAEERLVLVVERDDDEQLSLAMGDGRAKDVVPLVEVLGLSREVSA